MSKAQGDHYRTETNHGLNEYYDKVFFPALTKMIDEKETRYYVGDFIILCKQKNTVECDGWKLRGLRVTGREYFIRVHLNNEFDEKGNPTRNSLSVDHFTDAKEANKRFLELKEMCK